MSSFNSWYTDFIITSSSAHADFPAGGQRAGFINRHRLAANATSQVTTRREHRGELVPRYDDAGRQLQLTSHQRRESTITRFQHAVEQFNPISPATSAHSVLRASGILLR